MPEKRGQESLKSEKAPIWKVTRWCCRSGLCIDCHQRGNHGDMRKRKRITHADKLSKDKAELMTKNWSAYEAKTELM